MSQKPLIKFRELDDEDRPFIYNSWLKTYRKESVYAREMTAEVYYDNQRLVVSELLDQSKVLVVCNPEAEFQVYSYIVYEVSNDAIVIHFAYVKLPYRNLGLAKAMMAVIQGHNLDGADLPIIATHATHTFHKLAPKWKLTYNPYLARNVNGHEKNQDTTDLQCGEVRPGRADVFRQ